MDDQTREFCATHTPEEAYALGFDDGSRWTRRHQKELEQDAHNKKIEHITLGVIGLSLLALACSLASILHNIFTSI